MKISYLVLILFLLATNGVLFAQANNNCSSPEAKQFDFWVGDWKAEWKNDDGSTATGSNTIRKILGGCVVEENFNGNPAISLIGRSLSLYNSRRNIWQQTWVDNEGSYLDFTGNFENGKMTLSRDAITPKGKTIQQRMVFYNIEKNKFDWDWEISKDDGKNWELKWRIHYTRK